MQVFSYAALLAAAVDEACAWRTFSVKISEEIGGSDVTRRFRLYRLLILLVYHGARRLEFYILPVTAHMSSLQLAVSERHLTGIASIGVCGGGVCSSSKAGSWNPTGRDRCHGVFERE